MELKKINPIVYIITINWNCLDETLECLSSLEKIDYKSIKVIVVDNGSKNNEAGIIENKLPHVIVIKLLKNTGFTGGCNAGMRYALKKNAELILLLNNDTVVSKGFLEPLVKILLDNHDVGIVSPKILLYKSNKIWAMGGKISILTGVTIHIGKNEESEKYNHIIQPDFLSGCAVLIKREAIDKIGLLNDQYFAYYEDVEWSYKARKAGYKIQVIPESIIWHKKSASAGIKGSNKISPLQAFFWARNGLIFGHRNLTGIQRIVYIFNQFTIKFIFCSTRFKGLNAFLQYIRGLYYGINNKKVSF